MNGGLRIMASKSLALTEEESLYAHLSDYLDETLSGEPKKRFEENARKLNLGSIATDYGIQRGRLQIEAQRLFLDEKNLRDIHELVEDDASRANHEAEDIEAVGRSELKGNLLRFTVLLALAGTLFYGGFLLFGPKAKAPFKALDTLIYEAIVLTEDPEDRLDFPTEQLGEINNYFARYPDLGFSPKTMQEPGEGWDVNGATVIDYEVARVLATQFTAKNSGEKLFVFMYKGSIDQLPSSTPGNYQGLMYQAYASDRLNIIAWQMSPEVSGMLIGSRGAKELAELGFKMFGL